MLDIRNIGCPPLFAFLQKVEGIHTPMAAWIPSFLRAE
jgi:hypothetical protein